MKPHHPDHIAYRPDIDGLRALAVMAVLIFHAFPVLTGGFVGVDIFFVISGYLIAGNIFRDLQSNQFSMVGFYRRRIARLFPALFLVLLTTLIAGSIFFTPSEYLQLSKHAFWGAIGFANISLWSEAGYFDTDAIFKPLLHLWSLGVEEQFYLVAPLLLLILFKIKKHIFKILMGLFVVSFVLHINFGNVFRETSLFFLPFFRAWELLAGVLLAYGVERGLYKSENLAPIKRDIMSIIGLALAIIGIVTLSDKTLTPFGLLLPVGGTVLLIAAGSHAFVNRKIFSTKLAIGIGLISYPLYLWHWPLLSYLSILDSDNAPAARIAMLVLSFVLAYLTYKLFEKPVRTKARQSSLVAISLIIAMISVMSFAQIVSVKDGRVGWAARGGDVDHLFSLPQTNDVACVEKFWGNDLPQNVFLRCSNSDPKSKAEFGTALIGDSHAHHLFNGVNDYSTKNKKDVVLFSAVGCYPFETYPEGSACHENYKKIFNKLKEYKSVKTVILGAYIPYMLVDKPAFVERIRSVVKNLSEQGLKTIIMIDVPQLSFHPRQCIDRPLQFWETRSDRCFVERNVYDSNVTKYRSQVTTAIKGLKNVTVVDLASILCDAKSCRAKEGEDFLYRDTNHLSEFGSLYVSKQYKF